MKRVEVEIDTFGMRQALPSRIELNTPRTRRLGGSLALPNAARVQRGFCCVIAFRQACVAVVCLAAAVSVNAAERIDPARQLRGGAFVRALDRPLSVNRERVGIRELLERLSAESKVAIVLDRRVDPGSSIQAQLPLSSLRANLEAIAGQAGAVVRTVGDTVIVGPEDNLGLLRTLCVLRGIEFDALGEAAERRKFELARTFSFAWDDLERPADLVQRIAQDAELEVAEWELVPHDLWAHGVVVNMTAIEALSWVLVQYDLTFEWTGAATGVRIIPLEGTVAVTRDHPIRRIAPEEAARRVQERFPSREIAVKDRMLVATGLVEEHDAIAKLARGEDPDAAPRTVKQALLVNRRFSLRVVRQPAEAIFQSLQGDGGVDLRIDRDALSTAGVDVSQKISLEVTQATIEKLMDAICEPLGTTYAVDGETVSVPAP